MTNIPVRILRVSVLALITLLVAPVVSSKVSVAAEGGSRERHRFGLYLGVAGDPFPTAIGFNLGINLASFMRLTGGYGTISVSSIDSSGNSTTLTATTMGGGLKLLVPGWSLSPVGGINYAMVTLTGSGTSVSGFSGNGGHAYLTGGLDLQAGFGLNLGLGFNYSLMNGVGGLPYFNIGWFF